MALFDRLGADGALERLLDQERQLILAGKIEMLSRIGPEKERLLSRLGQGRAMSPELDRLRRKADRNQQLLEATARGIRNVSRRLAAMKSRKAQLSTYDRGGQMASLNPVKSTIERRA